MLVIIGITTVLQGNDSEEAANGGII